MLIIQPYSWVKEHPSKLQEQQQNKSKKKKKNQNSLQVACVVSVMKVMH